MKLGIVGHGVVGRALERLFQNGGHELTIYDAFQPGFNDAALVPMINGCDLVFVAVPTEERPDGRCDTSIVEEVCAWVDPPICIKSTVPPGTTDLLAGKHPRICFSPEYVGETAWHPWKSMDGKGFVIAGGDRETCELVVEAYQMALGPALRCHITDARSAELCKYMVNAFLATKVAFVNQFYDLARAWGIDFNGLRELWLADERLRMARSLERVWPGVVETHRRFKRPQHVVFDSWKRFDTPLRLKPGIDLAKLSPSEHGIRLVAVQPVKSKGLQRLVSEYSEKHGSRKPRISAER